MATLTVQQNQPQYYQAPYRPISRSNTTYGNMNEFWRTKRQRDPLIPKQVPLYVPKVSEYAPPYVDPSRNDTYYKRYMQLAQNVSYRHPDPGQPRERQGRSGGSWRHIKEVLGYTGSQVCFVDGLVRTYDKDVMKAGSSAFRNPPWVGQRSTPTYSANRHDVDFYSNHLRQEREKSSYIPGAVPNDRASAQPVSPTKYKGFYSYNS